jgi:restriction system protein
MSGVEFENWVADYFRKQGYAVEPTPVTGDHGIDLILRKDSAVFGVQCKRWSDAIGEPVLRDFYGSVSNGNFAGGFVVTTSSFTDPARLFAEGKPITLVGLADLIQTTLFSEKQL